MSGLNTQIEYSFMTVGHTKFSCDRCFGVFKKKCLVTPMHTLYDVACVCNKSGVCNISELVGTHDGKVMVECYDWAASLSEYFKKINNITDYHHFHFSAEEPGIVKCSVGIDGKPISINVLKKDHPPFHHRLPEVISPKGFTAEREAYLYNEIREFCKEGSEDLVAPAPTVKRLRH